jgi:hypothetical protein
VAADDLIFGVGRMFDALQPEFDWKIRIFRDESEAIAWLELQEGRSWAQRSRVTIKVDRQPRSSLPAGRGAVASDPATDNLGTSRRCTGAESELSHFSNVRRLSRRNRAPALVCTHADRLVE